MDTFGGPAGFSFDTKANEAYVADGIRNHRVAVIDMNTGAIKRSWGAYGNKPDDGAATAYTPGSSAPKQFGSVRCAKLASDGLVYVCDATNDRIQVFKKDGSFVKEHAIAPNTLGSGSVWDIAFSRDPQQKYIYVADGMNMKVRVLDRNTLEELTSFGDGGRQPGQFYAVHSVATDSKGNVYTVETYEGKRVQKFNFKGVGPVPANAKAVVWPSRTASRAVTKQLSTGATR
jgi:DNA-binding beta-propeller fold protein YncE